MEQREQRLEKLREIRESIPTNVPSFFSAFLPPEWPSNLEIEAATDTTEQAKRLRNYLKRLDV